MSATRPRDLSSGDTLLVLNAGSSSFKWTVFGPGADEQRSGVSESIDLGLDHLLTDMPRPDAVGHRVVHGGHRFTRPVCVDAQVRVELESLVALAPLHQSRALSGIDSVDARWPGICQVACFDTAFHATLPDAAARYALPREWVEAHGLRRFGAHGLSVEWSVRRVSAWMGSPRLRLVVCHLGGGSSMTAVKEGRSIDTTMGYTPLEGPVMSTRSGSVDPGLLLHLLMHCGMSLETLSDGLQRGSGLLGMSGVDGDLRSVRAAALRGEPSACAAIDHLLWSYRRAVGGMCGVLGSPQAVVFTGGIGEHQAFIRQEIASAIPGCELNHALNVQANGDCEIGRADAGMRVFVVKAREDCVIRDQMIELLRAEARSRN